MSEEFSHTQDPQTGFANKSYSVTAINSNMQSTINHFEANIYVTTSKKHFTSKNKTITPALGLIFFFLAL